jgi:hypothetical protein
MVKYNCLKIRTNWRVVGLNTYFIQKLSYFDKAYYNGVFNVYKNAKV